MTDEELQAQFARLQAAVIDAIDRLLAEEELSTGLVAAVLAHTAARIAYQAAQIGAGIAEDVTP